MPALRNNRHERFAQELATGKTADAAYVLAGYQENRSNAARLNAAQDIQKRVAEIQSLGAERAAITVETLIAEAESARSKAMSEKGGAAAAVAAITAKAKLAGLWREKVAQTDPSGENAPRYIISDRPMTEEEWIRERCGEIERPMAASREVISLCSFAFITVMRDTAAQCSPHKTEFLDDRIIRHLWHCPCCKAVFKSFPRFPKNARLVKQVMTKVDVFPPLNGT